MVQEDCAAESFTWQTILDSTSGQYRIALALVGSVLGLSRRVVLPAT